MNGSGQLGYSRSRYNVCKQEGFQQPHAGRSDDQVWHITTCTRKARRDAWTQRLWYVLRQTSVHVPATAHPLSALLPPQTLTVMGRHSAWVLVPSPRRR